MPVKYAVVGLNAYPSQNAPEDLEVWHQTREEATAEAVRLAEATPGRLWAVAEMITWHEVTAGGEAAKAFKPGW